MRPAFHGDSSGLQANPSIEDGDVDSLVVISLDDFDEETLKRPILTSPRSIEACRMLGVEPEELVNRPLEYFVSHATAGEEPALTVKRAARHEKKRKQHLCNVRAQRNELIEAELKGIHGGMSLQTRIFCHSPLAAKLSSYGSTCQGMAQRDLSVIERERRELERIHQRQAKEMQQLLSFELKMAEIHRERELKDQEFQRQQDLFKREKLLRQREADEQRRRKEIDKAEQQRLEAELEREQAQKRQREIMAQIEQAEREKERRLREQKSSEQERLRKQDEHRLRSELHLIRQQRVAETKSLEITRRDERRRHLLELKKQQKAQEMAEKQKKNKMRITSVLQDRDSMRQLQLEELMRKQQESEERRRRIDEERQKREDEMRLQAARKKETIEVVQLQLEQMEQQRRDRLVEQERQIEERLKAKELEKQLLRDEQKREERYQEEERRRVYERMEEQIEQRQKVTITKAEQKSEMAKMMHAQKKQLLRSRLHDAKLREEEIQAALVRRQKQDKYRMNLLMSRIESDNERTRKIKEQREQIIRRRQQIAIAASRQREQLLESFHKMQIAKKYELPKHLQRTLFTERPKSASALQTRSLTRNSSVDQFMQPSHCETFSRLRSSTRKRPSSATARNSSNNEIDLTGPSTSWYQRTSRSEIESEDGAEWDIHNDSDIQPSSINDPNTSFGVFEDEMDELRRKHNEELLCVLQQEHHAEEQREYLMNQVSDRPERSRMEKIFNKERAQASDRILRLTQQHEQALASRMQHR